MTQENHALSNAQKPTHGLSNGVAEQLIGLSYAMIITGTLLTLLEIPILGLADVGGVLPYTLTPLILGAVGLFYFAHYRTVCWILGIFGAWLSSAVGAQTPETALLLVSYVPLLFAAVAFARRGFWLDVCLLGILDGGVDLLLRVASAEPVQFSLRSFLDLAPLILGLAGLAILLFKHVQRQGDNSIPVAGTDEG